MSGGSSYPKTSTLNLHVGIDMDEVRIVRILVYDKKPER